MKFENTHVYNFEGAFHGMRNPMNSWDKSDSCFGIVKRNDQLEEVVYNWKKQFPNADDANLEIKLLNNGRLKEAEDSFAWEVAFIGPADMNLAQQLIKSGPEHRKFLRQIFVSVDITAPLYWFKQLDTYKVATVANSTSTMHKLASKPITIDCFETDDFDPNLIYFSGIGLEENSIGMLSEFFIEQLEMLRQKYIETKDKRFWKELVRWLPEGWLQTRTWTANYETIRAICSEGQRRHHKLSEWSGEENSFIAWARTLPYAQWFIFDDEEVPFAQENSIS